MGVNDIPRRKPLGIGYNHESYGVKPACRDAGERMLYISLSRGPHRVAGLREPTEQEVPHPTGVKHLRELVVSTP